MSEHQRHGHADRDVEQVHLTLFFFFPFLSLMSSAVTVKRVFYSTSSNDQFFMISDSQAITALKKGATLLKYGRRGKPKFYPFRLSSVSCFSHVFVYEKMTLLTRVAK